MRTGAHVSRISFETLFALAFAAVAGPGCERGADADTMREGVVSVSEPNRMGAAAAPEPEPACEVAAEGCPCPTDGETIACPGPKVHSGDYTTCAPSHRECSQGTWGACVGNVVYQSADALTEDYVSPCPHGTFVHWGGVALQGLTPGDSQIDVRVQTADALSTLDSAPVVNVARFDGPTNVDWTSPDVGPTLAQSGGATMSHLRVTLVLVPSEHGGSAPTVVDWQLSVGCSATP